MRPTLPALTSVRFFAALYVFLVHFGMFLVVGTPLADFGHMGSSGVSMFFVLSGFILVYVYGGRPVKPGRFWWARFARIWPAYLASLLFALPMFWDAVAARAHSGRLEELLARYLTGTQAWTFNAREMNLTTVLNNPSWSISTEAFFYLAFPLLLVLAWRLTPRQVVLWALLAWAVLMLPAWLNSAGVEWQFISRQIVYKSPAFRISEFNVGMATGVVFLKRREWLARPWLAWASWAAALVLLAFGMRWGIPRLAMISGALAPVFALVVGTLACRLGPARLLESRPLLFLGEASYAFYLFHMPVGLMVARWGGMVEGTHAHFFTSLALTLGVAAAAYVWVERPARTFLRGLASPRDRRDD